MKILHLVNLRLSTIAIAILLVVSSPTDARDVNGDGIETILLPLAFGGQEFAGAFGSRWKGVTWLHNDEDQVIGLYNSAGCTVPCGTYGPGYLDGIVPIASRPDLGALLTPHAGTHFTLSTRLWETSRLGQPRGVDIPIIREGEFFTSAKTFLGVPSDPGVRVALRVYDPRLGPADQPKSIRVEVLDSTRKILGTATLRPRKHVPEETHPGYDAILDIAAAFPAVLAHELVHIRVTPEFEGEYWAMVSVTDNETQTLSIITAQ